MNKLFYKIASRLSEIVKGTKFEGNIYMVGGSVRDLVMDKVIKDYDICITLPNGGVEFAEWLYKNDYLVYESVIYQTYGTAMFKLKDFPDDEIEAVHTRKEQYKDKNSRNPEQTYGTLEEDAFRRDLTCNALYYSISDNKILDPTGKGLEDIKNHVIRVTNPNPDIVFVDDPLRILRVCRFSSRYGWDITDESYQSMCRNVDRLSIISQERITDEFNKMIVCDNPVMALELLKNIGAMKYVIPELEETYEMTQNKYHGYNSVWCHSIRTVTHAPNNLVLRVAALLHDIGKIKCRTVDENGNVHFYKHELYSAELCETILKRMKYSNDFIKQVVLLVKNHMRTKNWSDDCGTMKMRSLRKMWYELGDNMDLCLDLIHADNMAHVSEYCLPNQIPFVKKQIKEMKDNGIDMTTYKLPVDGNDVMEVLNIPPCKEVKECLKWLMKLVYTKPDISRDILLKNIKQFGKNNNL